jgi:hypothetical protein
MEERELTVEDLLDPNTLLLYFADYCLGKPLSLKPLLRLRDYCKPLVQFDKWDEAVNTVREKHDRLMREISHLLIHYRFCLEEPRYPESTCKRLRRRVEAHVRGAKKLLARVEELIKEGEDLEVVRRGLFEHLMGRLSWMRNNLSRAIEEAQKLLAKDEAKEVKGGSAEGIVAQG